MTTGLGVGVGLAVGVGWSAASSFFRRSRVKDQSNRRTESGERNVVRNGHLPERDLVTGVGPVKIRQPRVRHRDGGTFSSEIAVFCVASFRAFL
jgi:hypothetical protein